MTAGLLMLIPAGHALAAGRALDLGPQPEGEPPSIAVDPAGNGLIVWSTASTVKYCVVLRSHTQCVNSSTLTPAGGEVVGAPNRRITGPADVDIDRRRGDVRRGGARSRGRLEGSSTATPSRPVASWCHPVSRCS